MKKKGILAALLISLIAAIFGGCFSFLDGFSSSEGPEISIILPEENDGHVCVDTGGMCLDCGKKLYSQGLEFVLSDDESYYTLKGKGTSTDTDLVVPETWHGKTVRYIELGALRDCTQLKSITLPFIGIAKNGFVATHFGVIFGALSAQKQNSYIPESLETVYITSGCRVDEYAFYGCANLRGVSLPEGIDSIGYHAFAGCKLSNIVIPASMKTINSSIAWEGSNIYYQGNIQDWCKISYDSSVNNHGFNLYIKGEKLTEVVIPKGVTSISDKAFYGILSIKKISIPNSVTSIGNDAFDGCNNLQFNKKDGLKYLGNENNPYVYLVDVKTREITSATIANGCKVIGDSVFYDCESLTSVTIPLGVTSIGDSAFRECWRLTSITIPESVTSIGDDAFFWCKSLTSITIPDGVTSIGTLAFDSCFSLQFNKKDGLKYLGNENNPYVYLVDVETWDITSATIANGCKVIGVSVFYDCTKLTSVTIPDSITSIGNFAFYNCDNLTSITIPDGVTSIGSSAFCECSGLTNVTIGDSITSIGNYAFYNCKRLTSITIPDGVTSIGSSMFRDCWGLTSVKMPNNVTSIGDYAFDGCSRLQLNEKDGLKYLGNDDNPYLYLIKADEDITTAVVHENCKTIAFDAFVGCWKLYRVDIPDDISPIKQAFNYTRSSISEICHQGETIRIEQLEGLPFFDKISIELARAAEEDGYALERVVGISFADVEGDWNGNLRFMAVASEKNKEYNITIYYRIKNANDVYDLLNSININNFTGCGGKTIVSYNSAQKFVKSGRFDGEMANLKSQGYEITVLDSCVREGKGGGKFRYEIVGTYKATLGDEVKYFTSVNQVDVLQASSDALFNYEISLEFQGETEITETQFILHEAGATLEYMAELIEMQERALAEKEAQKQ